MLNSFQCARNTAGKLAWPGVLTVWAFAALCGPAVAVEFEGIAQVSARHADSGTSFINSGTGILRYDESGTGLQQAALRVTQDFASSFSAEVVLNYYPDGEQRAGFTQALLKWKPASDRTVRLRARAGAFYPRMSAENVDISWLSPYTYTPSAINSWIGEEMRVVGVEASLFSPGRSRRSPWSWELTGAVYGANDPIGTLLAWRGFSMQDRQSLHHDRVQFAELPSVTTEPRFLAPTWAEPFHEIDNRLGGYVGAHLRYSSTSDLRVYHYDNRGDPLDLNRIRQYAWDTPFTSIALRHNLTANTRLLAQWMGGSSEMGPELVGIDFDSYYVMLSHRRGKHRVSARYDNWRVQEDDLLPEDPNASDGEGVTLAWRYDVSRRWQVGFEYVDTSNTAQNRITVAQPQFLRQQQVLAVLQYRFGK